MKIRKSFFSMLTAAVCIVSLCTAAFAEPASPACTDDGITYSTNGSYVTITGIADKTLSSLVIPAEISGLPVTAVSDEAFKGNEILTDAVIPDSVTEIGDYAFYGCSNLYDVSIPSSVMSIGKNAFDKTEIVDSQEGPVCYAGNWAVYSDSTQKIEIRNGTTGIADSTFSFDESCQKPESIQIPESVVIIGNNAFAGNSAIKSVSVPDSVKIIGDNAFAFCSSLTEVSLGSSVARIGEGAFLDCGSLSGIRIPDSTVSVGADAFLGTNDYNCQNGSEIYIDTWIVDCNDSQEDISVNIKSGTRGIADRAFQNIQCIKSVKLPSGMAVIGDYAFQNTGISDITAPVSVTSIGKNAFSDCKNLSDVTIKNPLCIINDSPDTFCNDTVLHVENNSTAYNYAVEYDRNFDYLSPESDMAVQSVTDIETVTSISVVTSVSIVTEVSVIPVTSMYVVTSVIPVEITSVVPVTSMYVITQCWEVTSILPVTSIIPVTSIVPVTVTSVIPVTSMYVITQCWEVTSVSLVTEVSVVTELSWLITEEYYTVTSIVPVTSLVTITSIYVVTEYREITSIIPVTSIVPISSLTQIPYTYTTTRDYYDYTVELNYNLENYPSQWYHADNAAFFCDGISVIDTEGNDLTNEAIIKFYLTPAELYDPDNKTFEYIVPFYVSVNGIEIRSELPVKIGLRGDADMNSNIDIRDVITIANSLTNTYYQIANDSFQAYLADVDENGKVNITDAVSICKYIMQGNDWSEIINNYYELTQFYDYGISEDSVSFYDETPILIGDISGNGSLDMIDVITICKHIMGINTINVEKQKIADYNGDGVVDILDAIAIAKILLEK